MTHRVLVGIFTAGTVGTELADILADIGRVYMTVDVEVGFLAMKLFSYGIRSFSKVEKVRIVKFQCFVEIYSSHTISFFIETLL